MGKEMIKQLKTTKIYDGVGSPTVQELIDFLSKFPKDMCVISSWEGQMETIEGAMVWGNEKLEKALVLNVDSGQIDYFEDGTLEF